MGWQWHQLDYMQIICTSLQTGNNISSSSLDFLQAECSFRRPTNSVRALKAVSALKAKYSNQHKNYPTRPGTEHRLAVLCVWQLSQCHTDISSSNNVTDIHQLHHHNHITTVHLTFHLFMAALHCTCGQHSILQLWFLLSFFPRLFSAVADWMSTILPHMIWS